MNNNNQQIQLTSVQSQNINLLKGLSILLVLFIHVSITDCMPELENTTVLGVYTHVVTRILVDNAVPMFFLISGFLFFLKKDSYANKWRKRFKSLVIPYLLWCFVGFMIPFVLQRVLGLEKMFSGTELKKIADFEAWDYVRMFWDIRQGAPILSVMWFLRNLIVFVALTPVIELLCKYLKFAFPIVLTVIYLFLPFGVPGVSSTSLWWFGMGCYFALGGAIYGVHWTD